MFEKAKKNDTSLSSCFLSTYIAVLTYNLGEVISIAWSIYDGE